MKMMKSNEHRAVLTVEAALILPIFLFAVLFFLYFFQLLYLQDSVQSGITEAGKFIARYQQLTGVEKLSDVTKLVILKERFYEYLDEESINENCILGGIYGISLGTSKIDETNGQIEITAIYFIRFPIPFFADKTSMVTQRVRTRAFVGRTMKNQQGSVDTDKEPSNESEDFLVYVTENGTVYHMDENCTHLKLTISGLRMEQLEDARNENGGKYKSCEKCVKNQWMEETVYITKEGDRYHNSLACSGLKRTVYAVYYSSVADKRKCIRCGE